MRSRARAAVLLASAWLGLAAPGARAQDTDVRLGVTLGGTGFVGLSVELLNGGHGVELTTSTVGFRDLSVSLVYKEYFGAAAMKPVLGGGLWVVVARPPEDERTGISLVARFPVGFDWSAGGGHALAAEINVNRALWVRRSDPEDEAPAQRRLVPLPGIAYRFRF